MAILKINSLGTSFSIKAEQDEKYLNKLLDYYNQITNALQNQNALKDQKQIAILAGILICDELYKEKEKSVNLQNILDNKNNSIINQEQSEIAQITDNLISKIERVL